LETKEYYVEPQTVFLDRGEWDSGYLRASFKICDPLCNENLKWFFDPQTEDEKKRGVISKDFVIQKKLPLYVIREIAERKDALGRKWGENEVHTASKLLSQRQIALSARM
ncbi:MAG: hypothetical protein AAF988_04560, partial [Pseudomonadota bacterium]